MTSTEPTVSVVTATRNRPHLLKQALRSLQRQSYQHFEAIVVDDGSPPEIHEEYRAIWRDLDERFSLRLASPPGGPGSDPGSGRNFGVRASHGELVAFLDHDDVWERDDHLEVGVGSLLQSGAGYYFTHVRFEPDCPLLMWVAPPNELRHCPLVSTVPRVHQVPLADFLRVMRHCHIHPSHSIVRREVFERAGGFIQGLKTADDVNLMLRIADLDPGILYRPEASVAMRLPEGKSFSLLSSQLDQILAERHALLDIRSRCQRPDVRRCARSREGWVLRQLSQYVAHRRAREGCRFAWEALLTYPTVGAALFAARTIAKSVRR